MQFQHKSGKKKAAKLQFQEPPPPAFRTAPRLQNHACILACGVETGFLGAHAVPHVLGDVQLLLGLNIRDDFADLVRGELVDKGGHHVPAELGFDAHVLDTRFAARKGKLLVLKEAE